MTALPDLAVGLLLARVARDHPSADPEEVIRLAIAELDAEIEQLVALRAEVDRRQAHIRATGLPTGLPALR